MRFPRRLAPLLGLLFFPDTLQASRPLTTEDASIIPRGKGQLEMSWDYAAAFSESRNHILLAVPGVGIADRVEFTLELPFVLAQQDGRGLEPGLGDIRSTVKGLLYPGKGAVPAFALQAYFKFDTGDDDDGSGTGNREAGFFGIVSKQIEQFFLHGMMGLDFTVSGPDRGQHDLIYGAAVDYTVGNFRGRPFHLVAEVFGNTNFNPAIAFNPATLLLGAVYELSEAWALDAAISVGLSGSGQDMNTTVGATFLFP